MGFCVCSCRRRWGPGEGDWWPLPDPLPPARGPPKGGRPFLPVALTGPRQLYLFLFLFFFKSVSSLGPGFRFHLPRFPRLAPIW